MPKLTESFVQSLKPDGRDRLWTDSALPGFALRITSNGTKIFIVQVRIKGRRPKAVLGRHPNLLSRGRVGLPYKP